MNDLSESEESDDESEGLNEYELRGEWGGERWCSRS